MLEADDLAGPARRRPPSTSTRSSATLFDEMLQRARRPAGRRARGPRDAGRGGDDLPHGHRGHARPHRPALHHRLQRARWGRCRASSRASRNVARDEHRHVAFGARFLRDMARARPALHARRSSARWPRSRRSPTACCGRKWCEGDDDEPTLFGVVGRRDARVRDEGARAAHEGHRPARGRVSRRDRLRRLRARSTCASAA